MAMPKTTMELYEIATTTMLERVDRKQRGAANAAAVPFLKDLLQSVFFEAHIAENGRSRLAARAGALRRYAPDKLGEIMRTTDEFPAFEDRAEMGHYVEVPAASTLGNVAWCRLMMVPPTLTKSLL